MEENTKNTPVENNQGTTQPEENGAQRTFTQEEVNQIVSERVNREHNKANNEYDTRMQELTKRENEFECRKWLQELKISPAVAGYIDTSNVEKFKETVGNLMLIFQGNGVPLSGTSSDNNSDELIRKAFQPK